MHVQLKQCIAALATHVELYNVRSYIYIYSYVYMNIHTSTYVYTHERLIIAYVLLA